MKNSSIIDLLKILTILAFFLLLSFTTKIWLPLLVSILFTFLFLPVVNWLDGEEIYKKRYNVPRVVAISLTFSLGFIIFSLLVIYTINPLVKQTILLIENIPIYIEKVKQNLDFVFAKYSGLHLHPMIQEKISTMGNYIGATLFDILGKLINLFFSLTTSIISLLLVPFLTFYFLKDGKKIITFIVELFPKKMHFQIKNIISQLGIVIKNYIQGQALISIIIGLLVYVGTWFLGLQYPLVLGIISTLFETIPYIGPICSAVPALFLGYMVNSLLMIKVLIFYIIIHQIESNIIVPHVMGNTIKVHPGVLMVAFLIGGELYGIIGMMAAMPTVALVRVLFKEVWYGKDKVNHD